MLMIQRAICIVLRLSHMSNFTYYNDLLANDIYTRYERSMRRNEISTFRIESFSQR